MAKQINLFGDEEIEKIDSNYTSKIKTPVYEPNNDKPDIFELVDKSKCIDLIRDIENSNVSDKEKQFLADAAQRHLVFNYTKIADYYSHASIEMQKLMEQSALVIIDFNKAIENGYVRMGELAEEQYLEEYSKGKEDGQ